jgi:hypothetical protein
MRKCTAKPYRPPASANLWIVMGARSLKGQLSARCGLGARSSKGAGASSPAPLQRQQRAQQHQHADHVARAACGDGGGVGVEKPQRHGRGREPGVRTSAREQRAEQQRREDVPRREEDLKGWKAVVTRVAEESVLPASRAGAGRGLAGGGARGGCARGLRRARARVLPMGSPGRGLPDASC